jgi:multisubunit Na+/H+ antiporter MnhC subunit
MNKKFLPWFLLFCAIGLSGTAAYYSVIGLSIIFSAVALPVIIMGSFLEISKIAIATYLHDKWKETYGILKIYLTIALVTLSVLTSIGIYGLLSTGFQKNIAGLEINNKKIENIEVKKERFEEIKGDYQKEKESLDKDITNLRNALSNNTTTQSIDRTTGQVITRANGGNRKAFENQLKVAQVSRDTISKKIEALNDSITKLDLNVLDLTSQEIESGELGAIKYLSEITGWDVKKTANFFILTLIFVFDPLAIALVISTNQAFKNYRRKEEDEKPEPYYEEIEVPESYLYSPKVTSQVEPKIVEVEKIIEVEKIVEVPVEVIKEVEKIVEVPVDRMIEVVREVPVIKEVEKKLYVRENGQIYNENGEYVGQEENTENKKVLKYTK